MIGTASRVSTGAASNSGAAGGIKVAAIFAAEEVSGPGRQLAAVAAALAQTGIELRVIQLWRRGHGRPPILGYLREHDVTAVTIEDRGPLDLGLPARVRAVLYDWSPDVLQSHGYKANAVAWALRRKGLSLPWVGFFHGSTNESFRASLYHWLDHRLLSSADRVVVMSSRQAGQFRGSADRVRLVYNAVVTLPDPSEERAETIRALENVPPPRIAVVGRLSPEKGVDVFLRACAILQSRNEILHAAIVGEGPERGRLEQLSRDLELDDVVTFVGAVQRMDHVYGSIELLVIPSRSEGLPNVLLEALAYDVPVVATDVGAIGDVLTDRRGGRIVPPDSPSELAASISTAIVECRSQEASEARQAMAARFSLRERVVQHCALYDELVRSHGAGRGGA